MSKVNNVNIEEQMEKLRMLVAWFESDDFTLEKAEGKFEEAAKLARDIEIKLSEIKNTVTVLKEKFDA